MCVCVRVLSLKGWRKAYLTTYGVRRLWLCADALARLLSLALYCQRRMGHVSMRACAWRSGEREGGGERDERGRAVESETERGRESACTAKRERDTRLLSVVPILRSHMRALDTGVLQRLMAKRKRNLGLSSRHFHMSLVSLPPSPAYTISPPPRPPTISPSLPAYLQHRYSVPSSTQRSVHRA